MALTSALAVVRRFAPELVVAVCAIAIAWVFAAVTLRAAGSMGLPLDDSYIYLTYAKQFGRGEPFSYYPGGGYSAGATSALWPMVLAPFWTVGARGHALVWVSFVLCAGLYAATAVGVVRLARKIVDDDEVIAGLAGVAALAISAFAWTALSGMEVAFASALMLAMLLLLVRADRAGPPGKALTACLAAASLSRPELTMMVGLVVAVAIWQRRKTWRVAAWWAVPLIAPLAWVTSNKLFAGHLFPNTGVVKSHFYMVGFDVDYWTSSMWTQVKKALGAFLWDGPLPLAPIFALAWVVGAVRVVLWGRRTDNRLVAALVVGAPWLLTVTVIATSAGPWDFQNYRYVGPGFPLYAVVAVAGLSWVRALLSRLWTRVGVAVVVTAIAGFGMPGMRADALLFAQGAIDTNVQVVTIGKYLHHKLPDAHVMFHDAGAIAYYSDDEVFDMLGLVTNDQAGVANNGPGSRFEFLESLPPEQRPTHFAYYAPWLTGTSDFYGEVLLQTLLKPSILTRSRQRLAGGEDMQVIVASWDHVGTAERPLAPPVPDGWEMVDRLDVADLKSEAEHEYRGALGRHEFGDRTAKWSFVEREARDWGLVIDGGRTIRGAEERFVMHVAAGKPVRLILRTGGTHNQNYQEPIEAPVPIQVFDGDRLVGKAVIPKPGDVFVEVPFDVAEHGEVLEVRTASRGMYRSFHWFALQPSG